MEEKTTAIKREVLKSIIDRYGVKGKKVLIQKAKESGVYKGYMHDEEIYNAIFTFAEFHKLHIQEFPDEPKPILKEVMYESIFTDHTTDTDDDDNILSVLKSEHEKLSKKLLKINQLIALYKK